MKKVALWHRLRRLRLQAAVLFDNGPVYDVAGSPNLSRLDHAEHDLRRALRRPRTTPWRQFHGENRLEHHAADVLHVPDRANSTFTFTGLNYQICSSNSDAVSWTSASVSNGGLVAYRVTNTTLTDRTARFSRSTSVNLNIGRVTTSCWQASGSLASGPWQPLGRSDQRRRQRHAVACGRARSILLWDTGSF